MVDVKHHDNIKMGERGMTPSTRKQDMCNNKEQNPHLQVEQTQSKGKVNIKNLYL